MTSEATVRSTSARTAGDAREVDAGEVAEGAAPGRQVGAAGVQEACAECLQQPGAAVGGGAAAQPQTMRRQPRPMAAARICPVPKVLAAMASRSLGRQRARAPRRSAISTTARSPSRRKLGRQRAHQGVLGGHRQAQPAAAGADGLEHALAAVGHAVSARCRPGARRGPAIGQRLGHDDRREGALEGVGRHEDPERSCDPSRLSHRGPGGRGTRGSRSSAGAPHRPAR